MPGTRVRVPAHWCALAACKLSYAMLSHAPYPILQHPIPSYRALSYPRGRAAEFQEPGGTRHGAGVLLRTTASAGLLKAPPAKMQAQMVNAAGANATYVKWEVS